MKKSWKILKLYFIAAGVAANIFVIWMAAGWPIFFDRWLEVSASAGPAVVRGLRVSRFCFFIPAWT